MYEYSGSWAACSKGTRPRHFEDLQVYFKAHALERLLDLIMPLPSIQSLGLALWFGTAASTQVLSGFESPSKDFRPKFRYWLPDASVDVEQVTGDIHALKSIGAGGLEFVPFYNYGFGDPKSPPTNEWDVYGFGTPAFKNVFRSALKAARDDHLRFDFALGASQGQGVPVEPLTPGLAMELAYGETTVNGGATFKGAIPELNANFNFVSGYMQEHERFGPNRLVAVVAGGIESTTNITDSSSKVVLDESSLIDLSSYTKEGYLTWRAPRKHGKYVIFALYERYTNQRSCSGAADAQNAIANGSWITDHFSAKGVALVTNFWEKHLLDKDIRGMLKATGEHSWEDSMEMQASLWWTPDFIERFQANRGYSPIKYLPLMFHQSNSYNNHTAPYNTTYVLHPTDSSQEKHLQDYRLTLNEGYVEYLEAYNTWAESLSLSHSCQIAYNLPLDMSGDVPVVGGPELESLGFPEIDHSRQFVGAAHLSGRNIISTEVGAVPTGGYSLSVPSLINLFRDAFAGGVNAMVIHGMQYGGEYMNATWPGYTPFQYVYSELWSPRQPAWEFMNDTMAYTARNQLALQAGKPRMDIAFYLYKQPWSATVFYEGDDLRTQGFTHEYLGPENLASDEVTVTNGLLAMQGPAYRALVIYHQEYITPEAALKLVKFAQQHLPIVVYGKLPTKTIGSSGQSVVSKAMKSLKSFRNVKLVGDDKPLPEVLKSVGVHPRMSVQSKGKTSDLYSVWRATDTVDMVYLYNRGPKETFHLSFEVSKDKLPYRLNAWTGEQEPMFVYQRTKGDNAIRLSVSLSESQTTILAFHPAQAKPRLHVVSHSDNIVAVRQQDRGDIAVLISDEKASSLTLSNEKEIKILALQGNLKVPTVKIQDWNLTIESWVPSSSSSTSRSSIEILPLGLQKELVPWSKMDVARNASGVGIYTSSFTIPKTNFETAAMIHFGPILGTLRAWVNGQLLPSADISDAGLDISQYVRSGKNSIEVRTSGTLFNAVKARVDWVKNGGQGPVAPALYTEQDWQHYGLVGPVTVNVLRRVMV
ncbi:hypothetical protein LCI18_006975 [Fusarium solani-melongenae]|uniref:Uncharacterized protein n=1 Tax=Fusarium solani subsp. cucurbitae TaxID=2747967 RepID=A0ACD3Z4J9_FUSSC|nr:hypothetical protein LCI18_006975 [Fusarium solani-melongenae]